MRTEKSIKNTLVTVIFHSVGLVVNFIVRAFFIRYLGSKYLGLNGLFTNILQVLSLAELGIGEAINYSLYKPLSEKNIEKCKSLMLLYKKLYVSLGIFITIAGLAFMPFVHLLIKDSTGLSNIYIIYILFILNTTVSYFYSYKWNILVADQKKYIVNIYRYIIYSVFKVFQIVYLIINKDFVGYMIIQVVSTFLENFVLSKVAEKQYLFLKEKNINELNAIDKTSIKNNFKAMMMHKIGNTLINSTDNIILSKFVGLNEVGIYSNYYMIINSINLIFVQAFAALTSSIGKLFVEESNQKNYYIFKKINFLNFCIYSTISVCLLCVINDFVTIWAGENFIFSKIVVYILILNFYINGMRKPVLMFREASGLFYKDRWKSIIEAIINLIVSIVLGIKFGTIGVFIGTLISVITVSMWVEPYILYKYNFKQNISKYFIIYIKYLSITVISAIISINISKYINFSPIVNIIAKGSICIVIEMTLIVLIFRKSNDYKYFVEKINNMIRRVVK